MPAATPLRGRCAHFAFALWAIQQPRVPSVREIMALTDLGYDAAREWRIDWINERAKAFLRPEDGYVSH